MYDESSDSPFALKLQFITNGEQRHTHRAATTLAATLSGVGDEQWQAVCAMFIQDAKTVLNLSWFHAVNGY